MSMIFYDNAPKYWAKGLPVIPLLPNQKRPAVNAWQIYADRLPTEEEMTAWLKHYPNGNIGLPLGPASGLVAVDIDTDDPKVLAALEAILPRSPWERVGKKGRVWMYRYTAEKTSRFQADEQMVCEILSRGTQVVLNPSIHPETKAPYFANSNLYDVVSSLPQLPVGVDQLIRDTLTRLGFQVGATSQGKILNFVPAGQRDSTMVWHAGLLARGVVRGERTLLQALGEMQYWVESYIEKVSGDPIDPKKACAKVVEFLKRDVNGPRKLSLPEGWDEGLSDEMKADLGLGFSVEDVRWTAGKILEQLAAEFQNHPDPMTEGHQSAIKGALARLARADEMVSALDEERICKFIVSQSMNTITLGALKREIAELKKGDIEGTNHNEIANEVVKHINQYGELRFHAGSFWQWGGSHWAVKSDDDILKVISGEFGFYPACKKTSDYTGVLRLMRSTVARDLQQIDLKGVNFANGFLSEHMELLDHNPDFGKTYVLPYRYMPDEAGRMPLFNQFLMDSWGQDGDFQEKVMALQEFMGAAVFGMAPKYQRAMLFFGQAGSGKSVASKILRSMMPEGSVSAVPPESWEDKFLPAQMYGKVLNFAGELSETKQIPGEIFKQVIEGDQITAQHKNQQPFTFRPECAQSFNSNHLPKTRDTSEGFTRRWLILEWSRRVPENKVVIDLETKIVSREREAIVAWAVQGLVRLREQNNYTLPTSHMVLVEQMASDNNTVRYFLNNCQTLQVGLDKTTARITANDLYTEYWSFCIATGIPRKVSAGVFIRMMRDLHQQMGFLVETSLTNLGSQEITFIGINTKGLRK